VAFALLIVGINRKTRPPAGQSVTKSQTLAHAESGRSSPPTRHSSRLRDGRGAQVPGRHICNVESPREFNALLRAFLLHESA
jgi:hypothetical protein